MGSFNPRVVGADQSANGNAAVNQLIALAGLGRLYSITIFNSGPDQYIQVFDSATLPAEGAVPKLQMKVYADNQNSFDFGDGRLFTQGIVICNSTTSMVKALGAADCLIDCTFRRSN